MSFRLSDLPLLVTLASVYVWRHSTREGTRKDERSAGKPGHEVYVLAQNKLSEERDVHPPTPLRVVSSPKGALMDIQNLPATLTVEQAAEVLGISRRSAYRAVERGELPTLRLGRRLLVPTARLLALLGVEQETLVPIRRVS